MASIKNIIFTVLFAGIFALHPSLNKGENPITYLQHLVYGNSLEISTNNSINKNLLEVRWICKTKNLNCKNLIIYKDGIKFNNIPSEKGNQKIVVYYNNKKIGEIPQNKTSKKQSHQYKIELLSKNNFLLFNGEIIGPSPYKTKPATVISSSSNFL